MKHGGTHHVLGRLHYIHAGTLKKSGVGRLNSVKADLKHDSVYEDLEGVSLSNRAVK